MNRYRPAKFYVAFEKSGEWLSEPVHVEDVIAEEGLTETEACEIRALQPGEIWMGYRRVETPHYRR